MKNITYTYQYFTNFNNLINWQDKKVKSYFINVIKNLPIIQIDK